MPGSVVRAVSQDLATFIMAQLGGATPTINNITGAIDAYVQTERNIDIPLSGVSVDYEVNKAELESLLVGSAPWRDKYTAGIGQALIRAIAAAITYDQYSIVRSAQESMIPVATLDTSIYMGTRFLGVRLARRIPASMTVSITRSGDTTDSLSIDPYTQFSASGVFLFNRETITFPSGVATLSTTLYEGQVQLTSFISNGSQYQSYVIGSNDYTISDIDTTVTVNNIAWTRTVFQQYFNIGLWEYSATDQVFEDETTPDGNISINFGNGINGLIPPLNNSISIKYVICNGQEGNADLTGAAITCGSTSLVTGTVTAAAINGTDEKSAQDYRSLAPGLFYAKYRATNRAAHSAVARRYPGVIDAVFEFQQELYPTDLRYMMIVRVTLLTNSVWDTAAWDAFVAWFTVLGIANAVYQRNDAVAVPADVTVDIYVRNLALSLDVIENKVKAKLLAAFVPRAGILGYNRPLTDFYNLVFEADPNIDYVDISVPAADITVSRYQYVTLGTITINMHYSDRGALT